MSVNTVGVASQGMVLLASCGWGPGMLLTTLRRPGRPPEEDPAQNASRAEVKKPGSGRRA